MPVYKPNTANVLGRKRQTGGRSESTIRRLKMQNETTVRDEKGKILFERFHSKEAEGDGRINPNRKWFGNTRVVGQTELDKMREVIDRETKPNQFLLRSAKLPTALIRDVQPEQIKLEQIEPFHETFGPKAQRRKAKLAAYDADEILKEAGDMIKGYVHGNDANSLQNIKSDENRQLVDPKLTRGSTNRVYSEIYKVIDSSDVICYVLDGRDPQQTRSEHVEKYMKLPENEHRHLIYILNKIDLVPIWSTKSWINKLSQVHPTVAYNAAARKPFGKAELISVLRQFSHLHKDKPNISIGFLGYPNVGKSSIINSLIGKESCKVAPVPGETKVWQYVNLTKKIFLIDAPGVVFPGKNLKSGVEDLKIVLQGVIRCENIQYPETMVPAILENVKPEHICRTYHLKSFKDAEDLMEQMAKKTGRLLKGGDCDKRAIGRKLLEDYVRGHLPHFVAPYDDQEILDYKNSIKAEREKWLHQTDSELIKFVNRQKLGQAGQEFKYLNEEADAKQKLLEKQALEDAMQEEVQEEGEESEEEEKKMAEESSKSEIQSFGSDDVDDAFDEKPLKKLIKEIKPKVPSLVLKNNLKRQKHKEGVQRATRIMQTKNSELLRAASTTLVDEKDLRMIVHPKKDKKKKERQGGFKHQKTGTHFYEEKRSQSAKK